MSEGSYGRGIYRPDGACSLFSGVNPRVVRNISVLDFFRASNDKLLAQVEEIRAAEKERAKELKLSLPAITVSGCFNGSRAVDNLTLHSGYICIDIDDIEDVEQVKRDLMTLPFVIMAGASVSGRGVFCLCLVDDGCDGHTHSHYFDYIRMEIEGGLGLKVDKSCRDVSRLRFYTYDAGLIEKEEAEPVSFERVLDFLHKAKEEVIEKKTETYGSGDIDDKRLGLLMDMIDRTGIDITCDRADWIRIGSAIASKYGESGYDYFKRISRHYPKFKESECRKQYSSFIRGGYQVGVSTIFYIAKSYGLVLN